MRDRSGASVCGRRASGVAIVRGLRVCGEEWSTATFRIPFCSKHFDALFSTGSRAESLAEFGAECRRETVFRLQPGPTPLCSHPGLRRAIPSSDLVVTAGGVGWGGAGVVVGAAELAVPTSSQRGCKGHHEPAGKVSRTVRSRPQRLPTTRCASAAHTRNAKSPPNVASSTTAGLATLPRRHE